jgi:hypothetical protein
MFKKISVFVVSLTAVFTTAIAADVESRLTELENQMKQSCTTTPMGTFGATTASARPDLPDGYNYFITADVLYWHARVGGTEFAYTDNDSLAHFPIKGRVKDMKFDWDWGFRVGLGYNFQHDGWDIHALYTYFDTNGSKTTTAGQNSILIPLRGSANIVEGAAPGLSPEFRYCTSAKSQFDFDYQVVDLELGRAYYLSEKFSVRPHAGLESAWFDLEQITRYTGGQRISSIFGLGPNTIHVKENCNFWGIGPRTGVDTKWYLGHGVSIFSNLAAALLFGYFDIEHREKYSEVEDLCRIRLHANKHAFSPAVQFQLGLRYDSYVFNNKQHVGVGLGFEAQYWWRQNQMLKINEEKIQRSVFGATSKYDKYAEDVTMYGATLDVKWDF